MTDAETYIDHEVRIRVLQELCSDNKTILKQMSDKMDNQFIWIENKMNEQFKWIVGLLIVALLMPVSLHLMRLV